MSPLIYQGGRRVASSDDQNTFPYNFTTTNVRRIIVLPKKKGTSRVIHIPTRDVAIFCQKLITSRFANYRFLDVVHGFVPGRSNLTNAYPHRNHQFTMSFDLEDFFGSVNSRKTFFENLPFEISNKCVVYQIDAKGRYYFLPQGFPSSPFFANLAAQGLDKSILNMCSRNLTRGTGEEIIYTRYADDLTFSFNLRETIDYIRNHVPQAINVAGFKINPQKTRLQYAKGGRRIITGIAVADQLFLPRVIKRKMRAVEHNLSRKILTVDQYRAEIVAKSETPPDYDNKMRDFLKQLSRLESVSRSYLSYKRLITTFIPKLKIHPISIPTDSSKTRSQFSRLIRAAHRKAQLPFLNRSFSSHDEKRIFDKIPPKTIPEYGEVAEEGRRQFVITHDPVYIAGMSLFTPGWRSCMHLLNGEYREGYWQWVLHPGTCIAAILDLTKSINIFGVSRPIMLARTIIYHLESGKIVHGRVYPGEEQAQKLSNWLENQNIFFIGKSDIGTRVRGSTPKYLPLPYYDNVTPIITADLTSKGWNKESIGLTIGHIDNGFLIAGPEY